MCRLLNRLRASGVDEVALPLLSQDALQTTMLMGKAHDGSLAVRAVLSREAISLDELFLAGV